MYPNDGVLPDCCDEYDSATLMYAAISNKTNVVHVLVQRGIDINVRKRKLTEVFIIAFQVVCILDDGVSPDCHDDDLATLIYAAMNNNTNIIHLML